MLFACTFFASGIGSEPTSLYLGTESKKETCWRRHTQLEGDSTTGCQYLTKSELDMNFYAGTWCWSGPEHQPMTVTSIHNKTPGDAFVNTGKLITHTQHNLTIANKTCTTLRDRHRGRQWVHGFKHQSGWASTEPCEEQ